MFAACRLRPAKDDTMRLWHCYHRGCLALGLGAGVTAYTHDDAVGAEPGASWRVAAEVDPLPFFSKGYSVHVGWKPDVAPRLRFTLGAFGYKGAEASSGSRNAGWKAKAHAIEASAAYFV